MPYQTTLVRNKYEGTEMSKDRPEHNDEIDLFEFCETLWKGKKKVFAATFIATMIGFAFSAHKSIPIEVSVGIQQAKQTVFLKYTSINDLLSQEGFLYHKVDNPQGYILDRNSIFKMFASEFNDYEEMAASLSKSGVVQNSIKDLDDREKQEALIGIAKQFKLSTKNEETLMLSFQWPDHQEGLQLVNEAIHQTLSNVKKNTISNLNILAEALDTRNKTALEHLLQRIDIIEQIQIEENRRRIEYLREQSSIAKELDIETNQFSESDLFQSETNTLSTGTPSHNIPYYLRGYRAIDTEISFIQSRTANQTNLYSDEYLEIKEKILLLETSLSPTQLRLASEAIAKNNPDDWIQFNLMTADVVLRDNRMQIVMLFMFLGGAIGVFYVLVSHAYKSRYMRPAKV